MKQNQSYLSVGYGIDLLIKPGLIILQGTINVCTEVLHLHGHVYNQALMFNNQKKLAIRITCKSSSDTITARTGEQYGCKDALVPDKTGLITPILKTFIYGCEVTKEPE